MSAQCVACTHFTLRDVGRMALRGCGRCAYDLPSSTYPALREHECMQFEAAEVIDKRKEWLCR